MWQPSQWETTLGQLGAFLAAQGAHHVEVLDKGPFLDVLWQPAGAPPQERCFVEADFAHLRTTPWLSPGSSISVTLLGALGHEIDREQFDVARIVEEADGFVVTGSSGGQYLSRHYAYSELRDHTQPASSRTEPTSSISSRMGSAPLTTASTARPMLVASEDRHKSPLRHRLHLTP